MSRKLTHSRVWQAIDCLATKYGHSPSALARRAGLDPTVFNKSKRHNRDGQQRWPSTETIARILAATGETLEDFIACDQGAIGGKPKRSKRR